MAEDKGVDGLQGLAAFVGLTAGVVPLAKVLLGGGPGFWLAWFPGTDSPPGEWLVPAVVVVVAVTVVMVLERAKTPR
ncbi:hypothetical protein [Nocardioides marinquilinus]